jgi:hypothetical protein
MLQCTDLDGTLIEDGEESDFIRNADDQTRAASEYFGKYLAPSGSVLVFNTGRSIGMVEGLLARKPGIMPTVRGGGANAAWRMPANCCCAQSLSCATPRYRQIIQSCKISLCHLFQNTQHYSSLQKVVRVELFAGRC